MAGVDFNLTGVWHGQYSYPDTRRAAVPFVASLLERGERLSGSVSERATVGPMAGRGLIAQLSGSRQGQIVTFLKRYETGSAPYLTVSYAGGLSEDGTEIEGSWTASGWAGKFLMIRQGSVTQAAERRVLEKV